MSDKVLFAWGSKSSIDKSTTVNGRLYVATDTKELYIGNNSQKLGISDIEVLSSEDSRTSLLAPLNKFYFVVETGNMYYYTNNSWISVNENLIDSYFGKSKNVVHLRDATYTSGGITATVFNNHISIKGATSDTGKASFYFKLEADSISTFDAGIDYVCSLQNVITNSSMPTSFYMWGNYVANGSGTAYQVISIPAKASTPTKRKVVISNASDSRTIDLRVFISKSVTIDVECDFMASQSTKDIDFEPPVRFLGRLPYKSIYPYNLNLKDSNSYLATYGITDAYTKNYIDSLVEFGRGDFTFDTNLANFTSCFFTYQRVKKFVIVRLYIVAGGNIASGTQINGLPYISKMSSFYKRVSCSGFTDKKIHLPYNCNYFKLYSTMSAGESIVDTIVYQIEPM